MNIERFNEIKAHMQIGMRVKLAENIFMVINENNHHLYCLLIEVIERAEAINDITNADYNYLCDKANCLMFALNENVKPLYKVIKS